jgi:hypothetical protein
MIRDCLSVQELEDLVEFRETVREGCRLNTITVEELAEHLRGVSTPFASLITVMTARRAKLAKLLNAIERERATVKESVDAANLSSPGNIARVQKLEKLINDYLYVNEGLRRTRGGRRPSLTKGRKAGKEK